jgi:glycosyltransferase involved in cell wall biosynthesis
MMAKLLKLSNLKKTIYYLKKNGFRKAYYAAVERASSERKDDYHYDSLPDSVLKEQAGKASEFSTRFSILVPAFETREEFLRALINSVLAQTCGNWELILADASKTDRVSEVVKEYTDSRIRYHRLKENLGISGNTNEALKTATGEYVALLDHDDLLTEDALFECASVIEAYRKDNLELRMLYSDEDKCNSNGTSFYEVNRKPEFNLDLILSNNYICHLLVMQRELMQELEFRSSVDGAQDHDIILRAVDRMMGEDRHAARKAKLPVAHIPKVLYHWRCYEGSTSENPESKRYA